ncbi:restriction endonuclease subunit S [Burkholderia gladioli]|uniref:restriction endonuclease subunit S n=1 Tax=Burkholderia gladioli TaxID=28095 RepID=UPI00164169F9|nr:restriction endonuclease subunit S [Burkholderia gladioli]
MKVVRLGEVCAQDRQSVKPGERPELRYIGLESIESGGGDFVAGGLSKTPETPMANSFRFTPEHVLYGKLRPYLNKVALPAFEGKCSTEIIPLRPSSDIDRAYLAYFLRHQPVVDLISARVAGARMPRADMDFVLSLPIPLPELAEQRRVVDLLSRAEGIVRLRREAQVKTQAIIPALFVDMFGDPATNPKGWPVEALGNVLRAADYGSSTKASDVGAGLPLIRMGNVSYDGAIDLTDLKYVELELDEAERFRLRKGDILFNRTNSKELVGKTGLWDADLDAVVASYFIRLRVDESHVCPFYVWAFMNSRHMKRVLFDTARGAIGQANINSKELKAFRVPLPTLHTQAEFEERCRELMGLGVVQARALQTAEHTFASILARSFGS